MVILVDLKKRSSIADQMVHGVCWFGTHVTVCILELLSETILGHILTYGIIFLDLKMLFFPVAHITGT